MPANTAGMAPKESTMTDHSSSTVLAVYWLLATVVHSIAFARLTNWIAKPHGSRSMAISSPSGVTL